MARGPSPFPLFTNPCVINRFIFGQEVVICYILLRKKISNFSIQLFFMIKYANIFDMRLIGRVLHNYTLHEEFARISYVHGLPRDVEESMQITCPALHVHPMSSKSALIDLYMYQNK